MLDAQVTLLLGTGISLLTAVIVDLLRAPHERMRDSEPFERVKIERGRQYSQKRTT